MSSQADHTPTGKVAGSSRAASSSVLTIDVLDEASGMAEVEDDQGRSFEVPTLWLPAAAEGLAYQVLPHPGGVSFIPLVGGARELRERSKQTLLEFSDEHEPDDDKPVEDKPVEDRPAAKGER